jgi:hypothetical protein
MRARGAVEVAKDMPGIFETARACPGWAYAEDTMIGFPNRCTSRLPHGDNPCLDDGSEGAISFARASLTAIDRIRGSIE